jgi:mRNA-degrading endonuclease toxin of MazEF toxin-antitoxin module
VGQPWCPPPREQTGQRPVVVWLSDALTSVLQSVLVVPLTTNTDRAKLAGTAVISATDVGPPTDSIALAFQIRAIPKNALEKRIRALTDSELAELERRPKSCSGTTPTRAGQSARGGSVPPTATSNSACRTNDAPRSELRHASACASGTKIV